MSSKLEDARKEIPIRGRNGILKLWALLEEDFFGWDSFSLRYGLVDGEGVIPEETELQHTHDYDQILWFLSGDPEDMLHLGAELEVDLGAEGIRHRFATPHAVIVPKGVPHFSPRVHRLDRPFYFLSVNLCGKLKAEIADENARPETGPWSRFFGEFSRQIRPLSFSANEPYHYGSERQQPSGGVSTFLGSDAAGLPVTMAWSTVCRDPFPPPSSFPLFPPSLPLPFSSVPLPLPPSSFLLFPPPSLFPSPPFPSKEGSFPSSFPVGCRAYSRGPLSPSFKPKRGGPSLGPPQSCFSLCCLI